MNWLSLVNGWFNVDVMLKADWYCIVWYGNGLFVVGGVLLIYCFMNTF